MANETLIRREDATEDKILHQFFCPIELAKPNLSRKNGSLPMTTSAAIMQAVARRSITDEESV
jgi:hypothetical protein